MEKQTNVFRVFIKAFVAFIYINKLYKKIQLKAGINNVLDKIYFTRRSAGYPGPGALPADGRTVFITIEAKL